MKWGGGSEVLLQERGTMSEITMVGYLGWIDGISFYLFGRWKIEFDGI